MVAIISRAQLIISMKLAELLLIICQHPWVEISSSYIALAKAGELIWSLLCFIAREITIPIANIHYDKKLKECENIFSTIQQSDLLNIATRTNRGQLCSNINRLQGVKKILGRILNSSYVNEASKAEARVLQDKVTKLLNVLQQCESNGLDDEKQIVDIYCIVISCLIDDVEKAKYIELCDAN